MLPHILYTLGISQNARCLSGVFNSRGMHTITSAACYVEARTELAIDISACALPHMFTIVIWLRIMILYTNIAKVLWSWYFA